MKFYNTDIFDCTGIYELYLLTLALRETHQYSTGKAILTWIILLVVLFVIGVVIVFVMLFSGFIASWNS